MSSLNSSLILQESDSSPNFTRGDSDLKSLQCIPPSVWEMNPLSALMFFVFICLTIFLQYFKKKYLNRRSKKEPVISFEDLERDAILMTVGTSQTKEKKNLRYKIYLIILTNNFINIDQ